MRRFVALALSLMLTACIHNNIDSRRTSSGDDIKPLASLLVFVECAEENYARQIEQVVAQELNGAVSRFEIGSAHLPLDSGIGAVFDKAEELNVDGALVVAIEGAAIDTDYNPMPGYVNGVAVYRPKSTSQFSGNYAARLFDLRTKGKHAKVWQARAKSKASILWGLRTIDDVSEDTVQEFVSELRRDRLIASTAN